MHPMLWFSTVENLGAGEEEKFPTTLIIAGAAAVVVVAAAGFIALRRSTK